jgi:hypothetical protein
MLHLVFSITSMEIESGVASGVLHHVALLRGVVCAKRAATDALHARAPLRRPARASRSCRRRRRPAWPWRWRRRPARRGTIGAPTGGRDDAAGKDEAPEGT